MSSQLVAPTASTRLRSPSLWRAARVPRSTLALLLVSILLPLVLFGLAAAQNRHDVLASATHHVERTTRLLHEHAMKVFETHQLMLDQVNERLKIVDWSKPDDVDKLRGLLVRMSVLLPQVADISVLDASGGVRVSTALPVGERGPNFADRDYFRALRAAPSPLPFVSRGAVGRISGLPIFTMAQRATSPDPGRFDGVVAVSIEQSYFKDFYRRAEREYAHLVILSRTDGNILASEPTLPAQMTPPQTLFGLSPTPPRRNQARETVVQQAMVDGVRRIFGVETIGDYPVVIGFGISRKSALAPWWRNVWGYGFVAALSSLSLFGVSGFAIRRIALEGRATERWRRTVAQLRTEMEGRLRVEDQLRQSQKMEAVGRLTGGIAHDFNNLLTVVIGSLDLLARRMKDADPRHRELVANAVDGAGRAAALTQRLLTFSRQQPLDPKPLAVNDLIEGMRTLLDRTLRESVLFELKLEAVDDRTSVDPNGLENAILNLCVNATDAMPRGGTLLVSTAEVDVDGATCAAAGDTFAPGPYVVVAVRDTGTGMPPDVVARAFEPFFTTKPVGKGTGLGLAQVYGFARQSGGHVNIESREGVGTTIRILLPRLVAEAVVTSPIETVPIVERVGAVTGVTILLVEDDDGVRRFAEAVLRDCGHRVVAAASGSDGLRALEAHPEIALLFTDIVLKGSMSGRDLAQAAERLRPGLPVLYTTGYVGDEAVVTEAPSEGNVDLLGKPYLAEALVSRIVALLDGEVTRIPQHAAAE